MPSAENQLRGLSFLTEALLMKTTTKVIGHIIGHMTSCSSCKASLHVQKSTI